MCQAIRDFLPDDCPQVPDDPAVNVFTVGYSGAGKSSLVKSLKQNAKGGISSFMAQIRKVSAETKTAGIKPYMIKHANIGKLQVYDLAGDEEFYSSHDAIISTSLSGPSSAVFLLVVSLQWSPKEIEKSLLYWLNFLRAKIPPNQHIPPHLLCIGSHLDLAGNMLERNVVFDTFLPIARASGFSVRGYIHMNCRFSKSDGMTRLKQMLAASFQGLHVVESMSFNAHCFHIFLLSIASNNPAIQLKTVLERSTTCNNCDGVLSFLPTRLEDLAILCDELSRRNLVLFLKSNEALVESWIVVDHKVLLSQVNGIVFSPKHFRTYRELASSTGVVPLSKLAAEFSDLESWLCDDISDNEIKIPGYQLHRLDRNRHGGGVLMYASEQLIVNPLPLCGSNLELLPLSVELLDQYICISIFYRPPSSHTDIFDNLFDSVINIDISRF